MKASEYFEKYDQRVMDDAKTDEVDAAGELLTEFVLETKTLLKKRNVSNNRAMLSCLKEINLKWNAMCNLFQKKYGQSPLLCDGYKSIMISLTPGLKEMWV